VACAPHYPADQHETTPTETSGDPIRAGIAAARSDVVVISMADLSDDLSVVDDMVRLIRDEGYDIVCASRYMRGGRQIGGPILKRTLSRVAGISLCWFGGLPIHDATNAFRAYRLSVLRDIPIESSGGFEYTLEVTAKAHVAGHRVTEVPSTWRDRTAGQSRFRLLKWLPHYLKWYFYALTRGWTIAGSRRTGWVDGRKQPNRHVVIKNLARKPGRNDRA